MHFCPIEFSALAELHDISKHTQGTLEHSTVHVLQNVLSMQGKTAADIATTTGSTLFLQPEVMLSPPMVEQYLSSGYTHVLVYEETGNDLDECRICGVLELEVRINSINSSSPRLLFQFLPKVLPKILILSFYKSSRCVYLKKRTLLSPLVR